MAMTHDLPETTKSLDQLIPTDPGVRKRVFAALLRAIADKYGKTER
jgi:hypothetical protein